MWSKAHITSTLERLRQENIYKFKANPGFALRHHLKKETPKTSVYPARCIVKLIYFKRIHSLSQHR